LTSAGSSKLEELRRRGCSRADECLLLPRSPAETRVASIEELGFAKAPRAAAAEC
jgi:hypothetical protein